MASILIIIPYFGTLPPWLHLFLESCRRNPTVNWLIITDGVIRDPPANVAIRSSSFAAYKSLLSRELRLVIDWPRPFKLCDVRPALGFVHRADLAGFDFWGYGDVDVIYGDIRRFYAGAVFDHDIISSHCWLVAGHLALFRNDAARVNLFRSIPDWAGLVTTPESRSVDEGRLTEFLFRDVAGADRNELLQRRESRFDITVAGARCRVLLREQYSTSLWPNRWIDGSDYPRKWYWRRGELSNDKAPDRQFLYCHFSAWHSPRWTDRKVAPWQRLAAIVSPRLGERPAAFSISENGFRPMAAHPWAHAARRLTKAIKGSAWPL